MDLHQRTAYNHIDHDVYNQLIGEADRAHRSKERSMKHNTNTSEHSRTRQRSRSIRLPPNWKSPYTPQLLLQLPESTIDIHGNAVKGIDGQHANH